MQPFHGGSTLEKGGAGDLGETAGSWGEEEGAAPIRRRSDVAVAEGGPL